MMKVPIVEINSRKQALRKILQTRVLDAVLLTGAADVHYYSGFSGSDSYFLFGKKKSFLVTDSRYREEAEKSAPQCELVLWQKSKCFTVGKLASKAGFRCLGFQEKKLSVAEFKILQTSTRGIKLSKSEEAVARPRQIKSDWEIKAIRKALRVAEAAFNELRGRLRVGMTEQDVALELDYQMRKFGACASAFPTIVAAKANASLPHAHPGRRKIAGGGLLLIDWGARVGFYNSDLTRTLFIGSISHLWKKRYEQVLVAQLVALRNVASGKKTAEIDRKARDILAGFSLAQYFTHSLGHGVGLEVHENPSLGRLNKSILREGMVVTIEPGVYFPKAGGIRIEDMILVKEKKGQDLSCLPKTLDWAVI